MEGVDKNITEFCALVAEINDISNELRKQKDNFYDGGHSFEKVYEYQINDLIRAQSKFKGLLKVINGGCQCIKCTTDQDSPLGQKIFRYACEICGNKRCPHHSDHELDCTNSNEVGQKGSIYE